MLHFYETEDLNKGDKNPYMRIFLSNDDYITQDFTTEKPTWKTSALDRLRFREKSYDYKKGTFTNVVLIKPEDEEVIRKFFSRYESTSVWCVIGRFQDDVRSKRLTKKRKKETDKIDAVMETLAEVPEDFFKWGYEVALSPSRYLIYKEIKKGTAKCYCTHCKNTTMVNRKEVLLKNNADGICPSCGSKVVCKPKGKLPKQMKDDRWVAYIEKYGTGFVWRYFHFFRNYQFGETVEIEDRSKEGKRTFYSAEYKRTSYDYRYYKDGTLRWCTEGTSWYNCVNSEHCCLYPNNLPEAWEHLPRMKYSGLAELSKQTPGIEILYESAIEKLKDFPRFEWLAKMGLTRLCSSILNDSTYSWRYKTNAEINYEGETIWEILGLSKENTRLLQQINGSRKEMKVLKALSEQNIAVTKEQLEEYISIFGENTDLIKNRSLPKEQFAKHVKKNGENPADIEKVHLVSFHKLIKYIKTESQRYPEYKKDPVQAMKNMAKDWCDYLGWVMDLDYDLTNMFYFMPNNFLAVHDRTYEEHYEQQNDVNIEELHAKFEYVRTIMKDMLNLSNVQDALQTKNRNLVLVVPNSLAEIKREGSALSHCVGTYVKRVANGETSIFFVRRKDEPDVPYYTLEWKNNDIVQCRGKRNCDMTPEVKQFTQLFKQKMLAAA